MQLGMIGLGRMGSGMTERLREGGHDVQTYDPNVEARTAGSLAELKEQLEPPRAFWMMIPAGEITENTFRQLLEIADPGDSIVDGGNSNFHDSKRRHGEAKEKGIHFVDAGVSGGIWGLEVGFCLMVGGDDEPVKRLEHVEALRVGLHQAVLDPVVDHLHVVPGARAAEVDPPARADRRPARLVRLRREHVEDRRQAPILDVDRKSTRLNSSH